MTTFGDIVTAAHKEIGEVAGSGVQLFSEDRMLERAISAFEMAFSMRFWDQYFEWFQVTLAGASGKITSATALANVRNPEDFAVVFKEGSDYPLPILPKGRNPYLLSGTTPLFWTLLPASDADAATKRLQIWPLAATGDLVVGGRVYPEGNITTDTAVYLDKLLLARGAAWLALAGEGLNDVHGETMKQLFNDRYKVITVQLAKQPIATGPNPAGIPTNWYMV